MPVIGVDARTLDDIYEAVVFQLSHFSCLGCDLEYGRRNVETSSGRSMATSSNLARSNIRFGALVTTSIWGCAYRLIHSTAYPDSFYLVFLSCELSFYRKPS